MSLTEKQKEQKRAFAKARREQGLCASCNNDALPDESRCGDHLRGANQINQVSTNEGTTHMKKVRLDQLNPNPWQPRTTVDDEYIEMLATDIKSVGRLLQEPLTRPAGEDAYQLAFGHSRIAALRLLHSRKEWPATFTVKVAELSDEEMAYIALSENRARKDLTALEELSAWSRALEIDGVTIQSLADRVNVDRSTMSKNLAILKLPRNVLAHIEDGRLKLRAARELLCLRTDTHSHNDMVKAVLKDCGEDSSTYSRGLPPDYRTKTVRASIRGLARGSSHRGDYSSGHSGQDRNWRPLFEAKDGGRAISFDVDEFKKAFGGFVHTLPDGKDSGGREWTCNVKEWGKWSARATRERNKAEAEAQASANGTETGAQASTNGTGPGAQATRPEPKPKGSVWLQAVKKDPVVTALVDAATLRKLKADNDVESLPDEIREALGTRILKLGYRYDPSVNELPTAAQPIIKGEEQYGRGDNPPMFDFSECATCTVGASWEESYKGSGHVQLFCGNKKAYMDKQSVGIERFLAWRDEIAARNRGEDLKLGMELASVLSSGMAKIVVRALLGVARDPEDVTTWADGRNWEMYDLQPAAAEQFAAVVGRDLPSQGHFEISQWAEYLDQFFADPPEDFDWPSAAAWLVMWQARLSAEFRGELTAVAMATESDEPESVREAIYCLQCGRTAAVKTNGAQNGITLNIVLHPTTLPELYEGLALTESKKPVDFLADLGTQRNTAYAMIRGELITLPVAIKLMERFGITAQEFCSLIKATVPAAPKRTGPRKKQQ